MDWEQDGPHSYTSTYCPGVSARLYWNKSWYLVVTIMDQQSKPSRIEVLDFTKASAKSVQDFVQHLFEVIYGTPKSDDASTPV